MADLPLDSPEIAHSRSARPHYSNDQLYAYFSLIELPSANLSSPLLAEPALARTRAHGLPFLAALMRHHLAAIPFENLALHFPPQRDVRLNDISLDVQEIYKHIVEHGAGRGGHCLQINCMFGTVLRSLGFEVMSAAGRVNTACQDVARLPGYKGPSYNGWDHMINLVTLSSQRYLVDVGMGARGPIVPLPLISGASAFSISPRVVRMLHGCIPEHTTSHASNALWRLEVRNHERSQWKPTYAFSEIEFLPVDFEIMNWYINASPRSWFTQQVFVGRMVLDAQRMEVVGDITLFEKTLRRRIHGIVDLEVECQSEREIVELLRKHFGIKLAEIDCTGIN